MTEIKVIHKYRENIMQIIYLLNKINKDLEISAQSQ